MPPYAEMDVRLIGATAFHPPADVDWSPHDGDDDGTALVEFAGRACYQSWGRPNPLTATNAGYVAHVMEVGHGSVLEHATASFYVTGISRACSHELVRHRHLSPSQLSQRYVPEDGTAPVVPDVVADDPELSALYDAAITAANTAYADLLNGLTRRFGSSSTSTRKLARQAARYVLPNATETRIVLTGNYRAWRHFVAMRATEHADREIRALAIRVLRHLQDAAPAAFDDFVIRRYRDHPSAPWTEVASTHLPVAAP